MIASQTSSGQVSHHPPVELLFDYAAGSSSESISLLVASHLTYCAECRAELARFEEVGGHCLDDLPPADLAAGSLESVLARLGQELPRPAPARPVAMPTDVDLPAPLRGYFERGEVDSAWGIVMPGFKEIRLPVGREGERVSLLRIKRGRALPSHTHLGDEATVVLAGGFTDVNGEYRRGDMAVTDPALDHRPVAMNDRSCVCLVVIGAPLRLTGPIGRLVNPLIKY